MGIRSRSANVVCPDVPMRPPYRGRSIERRFPARFGMAAEGRASGVERTHPDEQYGDVEESGDEDDLRCDGW